MAVESRASKRKSTAEVTQKSKKPKKIVEETVKVFKKKTEKPAPVEAAVVESNDVPAPAKTSSRKRAADFFEGDEAAVTPATTSKAKKVKKAEVKEVTEEITEAPVKKATKTKKPVVTAEPEENTETKVSKATGDKKRKKKGKISEDVEEAAEIAVVEPEEDELDDQTAALLKGFESSEDEDEVVDDETEGIENVPSVPTNKALQKKLKAAAENDETRGVIYVGRIPHGFYEHQMRAYFSQFGDITRLRLSRNKKTGASKHYAFVEFKSSEVARIVADTMDKYLMFNHILQVRTIPPERVHENLFAGANSRFKAVPRNKLAGKHLRQPLHKEGWEKRITKENKRRAAVSEKLKEIGYEFESPAVKSVDQLAVKAIEAPTEQLILTAEADNSADEGIISKEVTTTVESKPGKTTVVETIVTKRKKVDRKKSEASLKEVASEKTVSEKKGSKAKGKKTKVAA